MVASVGTIKLGKEPCFERYKLKKINLQSINCIAYSEYSICAYKAIKFFAHQIQWIVYTTYISYWFHSVYKHITHTSITVSYSWKFFPLEIRSQALTFTLLLHPFMVEHFFEHNHSLLIISIHFNSFPCTYIHQSPIQRNFNCANVVNFVICSKSATCFHTLRAAFSLRSHRWCCCCFCHHSCKFIHTYIYDSIRRWHSAPPSQIYDDMLSAAIPIEIEENFQRMKFNIHCT